MHLCAPQVRLCLKSTWYKIQGKKLDMDENLTGTRSSVMSVSVPLWSSFLGELKILYTLSKQTCMIYTFVHFVFVVIFCIYKSIIIERS